MFLRLSLFLLLIALMVPGIAQQQQHLHSQTLLEGETVEQAVARYRERLQESGVVISEWGSSAHAMKKPIAELDYRFVPEWQSKFQAEDAFRQLRDTRFIYDDNKPNFARRCSWLYPNDGCFARAALTGKNLGGWKYQRPAKIFVFGKLKVDTANSPAGYVKWWYHVVPMVSVDQKHYVFDPAIDPAGPLPLQDWLESMTDDVSSLKATVCCPYTYAPFDPWDKADASHEARAERDQKRFLPKEWQNLINLNRDPEKELGENPPWNSQE